MQDPATYAKIGTSSPSIMDIVPIDAPNIQDTEISAEVMITGIVLPEAMYRTFNTLKNKNNT